MKTIILPIMMMLAMVIIKAQTINTIAGTGKQGYSGDDGPAKNAELYKPYALVIDAAGNIYFSDTYNNVVRKIDAATNAISTIAGNNTVGFSGDSGLAVNAQLNNPNGIALDSAGNVYFADPNNMRIRKTTVSTGIITTVAGNGIGTYAGDGLLATNASLALPTGVAFDKHWNMYIADQWNNRIRKVDAATHIISTIAGNGYGAGGNGGYAGDGYAATSAELEKPYYFVIDSADNVYFADQWNNAVRKITASTSIITTVAGTGYGAGTGAGVYSGDNGPATSAELSIPSGLAADASGNIYITDAFNNRIRKLNISTGVITTIAGNGTYGFSGDGGNPDTCEMSHPLGIAIDASGNIYCADANNNCIRKITVAKNEDAVNNLKEPADISVYPTPTTGQMTVNLSGTKYSAIKIFDITGREIFTQLPVIKEQSFSVPINVSNVPSGIYIMRLVTNEGVISKQIIKE